ncbi:MAG: ABC transporter substrate-binding protein [gamma proteobacterium symbiont of Taylorina sp.]|nr:ABC transporter substrate-binding protein [gamma proteobacterium symbiont of Taylorina sp.]
MSQNITKITIFIALMFITAVAAAQNYSEDFYQGRVKVIYEDDEQGSENQDYSQTQGYSKNHSYPQNQGTYYSQNYQPRSFQLPTERSKSPVDLLEASINKVIVFLSRPQQASIDQITFFLHQEITPHFDFEYMARWVAGRYYRTMSPEQQREFAKTFAGLFVTTFVKKLTHFQNYPPVIGNFVSKRTGKNEATASVKVFQEKGGNVQVDFKFMKTAAGWKVIDVRANGISALLYYRNYFMEQIRRSQQHQAVFD